jgi:protein-disulfide isomerase
LPLTRREFAKATALFAFAGAGFSGLILPLVRPALADDAPSPADLADGGPDGDIMIGSDKAPVTIIEYASMTCPHCAHFSETTFPELKKRYIDTGKVRYTLRAFPLDPLAAAGFMLARCGGNDKYMPIVETLFAKQADWIVKEPLQPLKEIAKQFGITEDDFNKCLSNQKLLDSIQTVRTHAVDKLGVNSTPTFFINGKKLVGDISIDQMAKEIDPYLKEG